MNELIKLGINKSTKVQCFLTDLLKEADNDQEKENLIKALDDQKIVNGTLVSLLGMWNKKERIDELKDNMNNYMQAIERSLNGIEELSCELHTISERVNKL